MGNSGNFKDLKPLLASNFKLILAAKVVTTLPFTVKPIESGEHHFINLKILSWISGSLLFLYKLS